MPQNKVNERYNVPQKRRSLRLNVRETTDGIKTTSSPEKLEKMKKELSPAQIMRTREIQQESHPDSESESESESDEEEIDESEDNHSRKLKLPENRVPYNSIPIKLIPTKRMKDNKTFSSKKSTDHWIYKCSTIAVLIAITSIALIFLNSYDSVVSSFHDNDYNPDDRIQSILVDVKNTFMSMKSRYKNQEKSLWNDAFSSIKNLLQKPDKPSIIVLLGNKADALDCLVVLLGNVSSNALNSNILQLTPEKLEPNVGSVIESLRQKIQYNKAVIVWDLLNINVEALKAFHNLCDTHNPLVKEVIYIIAVIAEGYDQYSNPLRFIENELSKKLSGKMKDDAIQPLITRITDGAILAIKPEPDLIDCPLPKVKKY